jgi:hypothetical protein
LVLHFWSISGSTAGSYSARLRWSEIGEALPLSLQETVRLEGPGRRGPTVERDSPSQRSWE